MALNLDQICDALIASDDMRTLTNKIYGMYLTINNIQNVLTSQTQQLASYQDQLTSYNSQLATKQAALAAALQSQITSDPATSVSNISTDATITNLNADIAQLNQIITNLNTTIDNINTSNTRYSSMLTQTQTDFVSSSTTLVNAVLSMNLGLNETQVATMVGDPTTRTLVNTYNGILTAIDNISTGITNLTETLAQQQAALDNYNNNTAPAAFASLKAAMKAALSS